MPYKFSESTIILRKTTRVLTGRSYLFDKKRMGNPLTTEYFYYPDEVEFMKAMDLYKREKNRPFPEPSDILNVLLNLGYTRIPSFNSGYVLNESKLARAIERYKKKKKKRFLNCCDILSVAKDIGYRQTGKKEG